MNEIVNYVERAFSGIAETKKKADIMREIAESMENNANRLINEGKDYEDAVNKAIVDFGDLNEIIDELKEKTENQKNRSLSSLWFSVIGSLVVIALVIFINLYYTPDSIWWVYPAFGVLWWPLCMFFFGNWRKKQ